MPIVNFAAQRFALAASGRDAVNAWVWGSAQALKTLKKRGESHLSAARFVSPLWLDSLKKYSPRNHSSNKLE